MHSLLELRRKRRKGTGKWDAGHKFQTATTSINKWDDGGFDRLTGPHRRGPKIYPAMNNEIINVATVSESSNLSEIGPIAPAGADDANVVLKTRVPANTDEYHFIALERF